MELDIKTFARKGLEAELVRLDAERARVTALLATLGSQTGGDRRSSVPQVVAVGRARKMSIEGRKRIQEAVRRRWERVRAAQATSKAAAAPSSTAGAGEVPSVRETASKSPTRKRQTPSKRAGNRKK